MTAMSQEPMVNEEIIARQPSKAEAIIRLLMARIAKKSRRIAKLERLPLHHGA